MGSIQQHLQAACTRVSFSLEPSLPGVVAGFTVKPLSNIRCNPAACRHYSCPESQLVTVPSRRLHCEGEPAKAARLPVEPPGLSYRAHHCGKCLLTASFFTRAKIAVSICQLYCFLVITEMLTRVSSASLGCIVLLALVTQVLSQALMSSELVERKLPPGTCTASIPCADGSCCNSA